jgi:hypothetical protein
MLAVASGVRVGRRVTTGARGAGLDLTEAARTTGAQSDTPVSSRRVGAGTTNAGRGGAGRDLKDPFPPDRGSEPAPRDGEASGDEGRAKARSSAPAVPSTSAPSAIRRGSVPCLSR